MIRDPNDPQHYTWHGLFCRYSWWITIENKVFVIVERYRADTSEANPDGSAMGYVEILYKHREDTIRIEWVELVQQFKDGKLKRTSSSF